MARLFPALRPEQIQNPGERGVLFVEVKGGSLVFDGREWVHEVRARYGSEQGPDRAYRTREHEPRPVEGLAARRPPRLCEVDGCGGEHLAKGLCSYHWGVEYRRRLGTGPSRRRSGRVTTGSRACR